MNGNGSKWKSSATLPAIQARTMIVWRMMKRQLPRKPVTASATRAPIGASSTMTLLTGCRLGDMR